MSSVLGRLLTSAPADRVAVHLERWPAERAALAEITGRVLAEMLTGRPEWRRVPDADGVRDTLTVAAVSEQDERRLAALLRHDGDGRVWVDFEPGRFAEIARGVANAQTDARMPLAPTGVALLADGVVRPLVDVLLAPHVIASGGGPTSASGRNTAWQRSRVAYATLGLEPGPPSPESTLDEVTAALVRSWATPPSDLGDRAMALLCTWLAEQVHRKVGKDGRWSARDVVNQRTRRWLDGTLSTPEALAAYVDVPLRDAAPVPAAAPACVLERLDVLRAVWDAFDAAHAGAADPVASNRLYGVFTGSTDREHQLDERVFGAALLARVADLWGTQLPPTWADGRLRTVDRPVGTALAILGLPLAAWDRLGIVLGWWASLSGDQFTSGDSSHVRWAAELERLGMPIEAPFLADLDAFDRPYLSLPLGFVGEEADFMAGYETGELPRTPAAEARYQRLLGTYEAQVQEFRSARQHERGEGYRGWRDQLTAARRAWAARHLEAVLDSRWQPMLRDAVEAFTAAQAARTKPLTDRQFCSPPVRAFANTWSAGRLTPAAHAFGLERTFAQDYASATARTSEEVTTRAAEQLGLTALDKAHDTRDWDTVRAHFALRDVVDVVRTALESERQPNPSRLRPSTLLELARVLDTDAAGVWPAAVDAVRGAM